MPFDAAARILCRSQSERNLLGDCRLVNVVALYFVHREQGWLWYAASPYELWPSWTYDVSNPEKARNSVARAIDAEDLVGVYEMTDPELLRDVSREDFLRRARERVDRYNAWEVAEREHNYPEEGKPRPASPGPASVQTGKMNGEAFGLDVEHGEEGGRQVARVWWLNKERGRDPRGAETFVNVGDKWYWRPKLEYTAWPVGANVRAPMSPTSQRSGHNP